MLTFVYVTIRAKVKRQCLMAWQWFDWHINPIRKQTNKIKYKCSKGQKGSRLQNNPTMNKMKTNTWPHSFNSKTYTLEDATLGMAWSCYAKTYNKCQYTKQKHTTTKIQSIRPNITIDAIPRRRRKLKKFQSLNKVIMIQSKGLLHQA